MNFVKESRVRDRALFLNKLPLLCTIFSKWTFQALHRKEPNALFLDVLLSNELSCECCLSFPIHISSETEVEEWHSSV